MSLVKQFVLSIVTLLGPFWILVLMAATPAVPQQAQQGVMQINVPATVILPNVNAINTQTGTAYTLQVGDNNGLVVFTSASPVTLTVPAGLGPGFFVQILQAGAGIVTPVAASGVTIHQRLQLTKSAGQWAPFFLVGFSSSGFVLDGDLQ